MIARWLVPAFVLALPLVTQSQLPRAAAYGGDEDPVVRVWIPGTWTFGFGEAVPVSFEVSEAAHVAVFRIDRNGRLMVLWPQTNNLQTAARARREYRITSPNSSLAAFHADYEFGQGMVIAIASPDPIDLSGMRRFRNDRSYFYYASAQQPYIGGVKRIVDRLTQEILYASDSPYDYDVAFYSAAGRGSFGNTYCGDGYGAYRRARYASYSRPYSLGLWDDCYSNRFYSYYAYCAGLAAFYGSYYFSPFCRFANPWWPGTGGPIAGTPQPQQPTPNIGMIDSVIARPIATTPVTEQPTGTTHIVRMDAAEPPNVTRWLPEDEDDAISLPARFRRDPSAQRGGGGTNIPTREEGFPRNPNTGIRVADQPPGRSPGTVFMPPDREAPRPVVWRDTERNNGSTYSTPRWERPSSAEPRSPSVDRGHTSTGTSSPTPAVITPKTDATVTKTDGGKASDAKGSTERKPQQ